MKINFLLSPAKFILVFIPFFANAQSAIIPDWLVKPNSSLVSGDVRIADIAKTEDNSIYAVGSFSKTVDFDPGPDTFNLTSIPGTSIFVAKYSREGKLVFAFAIHGSYSGDYNTMANSVATDKLGNIYITGTFSDIVDFDPGAGTAILTTSNYGNEDAFFAKYDKNGNFIFAKQLGGNSYQIANALAVDNNFNIYITGIFQGRTSDFDPGPGTAILPYNDGDDVFFAKYDINGNYIFANALSGSKDESAYGLCLDKDKNILVTGFFNSSSFDVDPSANSVYLFTNGYSDAFFSKYDSLGNYLTAGALGGNGSDFANGISTDENENIIVTGMFGGTADFDPLPGAQHVYSKTSNGIHDIFVAKYSPVGNLIFANAIGGLAEDIGTDVQTDEFGNVYVSGTFFSQQVDFDTGNGIDTLSALGGNDIFFTKYNSSGKYIYAKQIGGIQNESPSKMVVISGEKILIAGTFSGRVDFNPGRKTEYKNSQTINSFISLFDKQAHLLAVSVFDNYNDYNLYSEIKRIAYDKKGNIYVAGMFEGKIDFDPGPGTYYLTSLSDAFSEQISNAHGDIYFAKYDSTGKLLFAKSIGSYMGDYATGIALDEDNNIYITGYFEKKCYFNVSPDTIFLTVDKGREHEHFFAKYDKNGNFVFAKGISLNTNYNNSICGIAIDKSKNIYIAGDFHEGDFDPDSGIVKVNAIGWTDIYFAKYDSLGKFIYVKNIGKSEPDPTYELCNDIKISQSQNLIICGSMQGTYVDFDPGPGTYYLKGKKDIPSIHYVAGYTLNGDFLFATNATMYKNSKSEANRLTIDSHNNIYITGDYRGKIDFDPGPDSFIVQKNNFDNNFFFAKYNAAGKFIYGKTFTPGSKNYYAELYCNAITADKNNYLFITGELSDKADFDSGADTAYLAVPEDNQSNAFIAKYDSSGNYIYAYNLPAQDSAYHSRSWGNDILVNNKGQIIFAGASIGNTDFDPGNGTLFLNPSYTDTYFSFLVKYHQSNIFSEPENIYANVNEQIFMNNAKRK